MTNGAENGAIVAGKAAAYGGATYAAWALRRLGSLASSAAALPSRRSGLAL